jgi:hypothetical protein
MAFRCWAAACCMAAANWSLLILSLLAAQMLLANPWGAMLGAALDAASSSCQMRLRYDAASC